MTYTSIIEVCRFLRRNQTEAEKIFWEAVRNRQINGKKMDRQFPVNVSDSEIAKYFIADFYCFEHKLVLEIDGGIHETQKEYDALRTMLIENKGLKVIRFKNKDVFGRLDWVITELKRYLI